MTRIAAPPERGGTGRLAPGLYLVATPIGSARDITLRALDVLAAADVIAAEDTRTARKLMEIHGIALGERRLVAYHDHSSETARARLIGAVAEGQSVAYVSEAGTPLISDPGYQLVRDAQSAEISVTAVPGASAVLSALCVAGLPTDKFLFAGFAPSAQAARRTFLEAFKDVPATLVLYESPKRIQKLLADSAVVFGDRSCALCRELTKKFEETRVGSLTEIHDSVVATPPKGEIVLVIGRGDGADISWDQIDVALRDAMASMRVKDAATAVAGQFGLSKRDIYQRALELGKQ